jgi:hypothetical protein
MARARAKQNNCVYPCITVPPDRSGRGDDSISLAPITLFRQAAQPSAFSAEEKKEHTSMATPRFSLVFRLLVGLSRK